MVLTIIARTDNVDDEVMAALDEALARHAEKWMKLSRPKLRDRVDLWVASISAEAGMWIYPVSAGDIHRDADSAQVLGEIELIGWRLEHANWVFIQTGQTSRSKFLTTGQHTVTNGEVVGIYLFRRDDTNRSR
jgi:hypothetical protein